MNFCVIFDEQEKEEKVRSYSAMSIGSNSPTGRVASISTNRNCSVQDLLNFVLEYDEEEDLEVFCPTEIQQELIEMGLFDYNSEYYRETVAMLLEKNL